jgi:phenylacetic acid degradation operon negative regulatory protein
MAVMLTVVSESVTGRRSESMPDRGPAARVVAFLFGVSGRPELPGPALVALLGDLGTSPAAARAAIARLRREGNLAAARHGRTAHYRLAGDLARGFERIRTAGTGPAPWPGHFHALIHQIPEQRRAYRDRLRRTAALAGFGLLGSGILISLRERWADLAPILDQAPADAVLYQGQLALAEADAARAAAQAWNLPALDRRYADHLARLRQVLADPDVPTGADALRRYATLVSPVTVDTLRAPVLPTGMYPARWCLPELRATIGALGQAFLPAAAEHIAARLRAADAGRVPGGSG